MKSAFIFAFLLIFTMATRLHAEVPLEARSKVYSWPNQALLFQDLLRDNEAKLSMDLDVLKSVVIPSERVFEKAVTLDVREVSKLLRGALKGQAHRNVQFRLPHELRIEPQPQKHLESRLTFDLIRGLQKDCNCRVEISNLQVQWPESLVPETRWAWEKLPATSSLRGSLFLGMDFQVGPQQHRRWVQAQVRVLRRVPVATRSIAYGERFSDGNVREDWRDVSYSPQDSLTPADLLGFSSNRLIVAGQAIHRRDLVKPNVVKFGDSVRVHRRTGALEVTVTGVAQQAGAIGESIKVKITSTNKLVSAQIEDSGKVRVQ